MLWRVYLPVTVELSYKSTVENSWRSHSRTGRTHSRFGTDINHLEIKHGINF